ncbi:hypothetical protein AgCh_035908 [Apium graveolens]
MGITRHYTTPYTPQQNGVVERRNRTVMEMVRSFLKEKGMPAMLWGEAVRHAVYVLNRLPIRALTGHIRIPSLGMKKLDDRSMPVMNLGREPGTKGYRLFSPDENKIYESVGMEGNFYETSVGRHYSTATSDEYDSRTPISSNSIPTSTLVTPLSQTSVTSRLNADNYDDSTEPRRVRKLSDVYNDMEEVVLDEELYLMGTEEPANYKEASKDKCWKRAMEAEIESIEKNGTWKLTELPAGQKMIGLKWIFKLKKDVAGNIVKHKARLVAKGYAQEQGVDYEEVFAPVTSLETVRLLLALAAKNSWQVLHMDVKTAFLNGEIAEDVFIAQPEDMQRIEEFKKQMGRKFKMMDLGKLSYYLRIEVRQEAEYIELKQSGYAEKLLEKVGMNDCNPTKYPMDPKEQISKDEKGRPVDATAYKSIVGGLRYLVNTRPDIAFSVGVVSRYMECPTMIHLSAVKRILRYVKGTLQYGLIYAQNSGNNVITRFSDSDLGGVIDDRRSTGGKSSTKNQKRRGPTKMNHVFTRKLEDRPIICINSEFQPYSKKDEVVNELSRYLGTIERVPEEEKNGWWEYVKIKYIILEEGKYWVLKTLDDNWRVYKSRVKSRYFKKFYNDRDRVKSKHVNIPLEQFMVILKYWSDEDVQDKVEKNVANRKKVTDTHIVGRTSFAQLCSKMADRLDDDEKDRDDNDGDEDGGGDESDEDGAELDSDGGHEST